MISSMMENAEPQETIHDALDQNLAELKLERPSKTEETLREYNDSEIEETIERISKILQTQKSSLGQGSTKRRKGSENISLLILPILIPVALYITSIILLMFYYMFFGFPPEGISTAFSFERILLPMTGVAAIALVLFLFVQLRRKPSPVIFFRTKGGALSRQIIPQHVPSKQSNIEGKGSLVALSGTTLENVKKTIKSFGRKIEKNINLLSSSEERFQVFPDHRIKSRNTQIGKHSKAITLSQRGRYVWYQFPKKRPWDIALAPTIRSAAPHQITRKPQDLKVKIDSQDVRVKVRETRTPSTVLLLIDMSESMALSLDNIRAAVMNLHKSAYHQRDRVGLIVFKGNEAFTIQPPTSNLNLVMRKLVQIGASDFTPLAAGMVKAWQLFRIEKYRNKEIIPILVMISDGIANVPLERTLSPFTRQRFMNSSQADVLDAAFLLAKSNIQMIVINPDHRLEERYPKIKSRGLGWYTPINLLLEITRIVQGRYYGITEKGDIQSTIMTEAITSITPRRSIR
jgi:Mg-chelatase subunit ChlD